MTDAAMNGWAEVELYRWQYGELPGDDEKQLNIPRALRNGAKLMPTDKCPGRFNVAQVMEYLANVLEGRGMNNKKITDLIDQLVTIHTKRILSQKLKKQTAKRLGIQKAMWQEESNLKGQIMGILELA